MKGLIFTYVMTYGGAMLSLYNPFIGLLIYICFAIIRPESLWYWAVPPGSYSRIVAIALLIGWAMNGFGDWRFGRARGILFALLGFLGWATVSGFQASDQAWAWGWVEELVKIVLPFMVGLTIIDSAQKLKQIAWVIVLSHGYVAYELNLSYYSGFNRVQELGFGSMDNNCIAIAMVTCAALAFFLGLNAAAWWQKGLAFISAMLMVHVVMLAFSRGGMLALIITGIVAFVLIPKKPIHYATLVLAVIVAIRLAGPQVVERFATTFADEKERDTSAESRLLMWGHCIDAMLKNPVLGLGPHHFPIVAQGYGLTRLKEAHSLWLQIGAELGFPGLAFLLAFYGLCVLRLWPLARGKTEVDDPWYQDSARMVIAAMVGFMVSAQFVSLPGLEAPYYIILIGAGVLKLATREQELAEYDQLPLDEDSSAEASQADDYAAGQLSAAPLHHGGPGWNGIPFR
jgi:probable O-glycosylation ligase (exosortase A-associated)